jgi:hypothetical protein
VRNGEKTARIQRQSTEKKVKSDYSSSANHNTSSSTHGRHKPAQQTAALKRPRYCGDDNNTYHDEYEQDNETTALQKKPKANNSRNDKNNTKSSSGKESGEDNELYCVCNLPSYGNMIACDGKKCPNPSQWYHLECVGISDGQQPDTWYIYICIDIDWNHTLLCCCRRLCPECDPKAFAAVLKKKKKARKLQSQQTSSNGGNSSSMSSSNANAGNNNANAASRR